MADATPTQDPTIFDMAAANLEKAKAVAASGQAKPTPFMPDAVRAEAVDLAAVIKNNKDASTQQAKDEALQLTAEVNVPGIPNGKRDPITGKPLYGVVCTVKRFTGYEEAQITFKSREGAQQDDAKLYPDPAQLSSPEARSAWWQDIWRLMYGLTPATKRLLAAIHTGNPMATADMFTVQTATHWLKCRESVLVADPLLKAINILSVFSKDLNTTTELDTYKMFPSVFSELVSAYKGGFLHEFLMGTPEVIQFVVDNVKMLEELRLLVLNEEAKTYARYNKEAIKQALREIWNETQGEKPMPTVDLSTPFGADMEFVTPPVFGVVPQMDFTGFGAKADEEATGGPIPGDSDDSNQDAADREDKDRPRDADEDEEPEAPDPSTNPAAAPGDSYTLGVLS